ncbi:bifunctional sugar-1-phosphate nucleotidylyltransferase/acetyltransferase [Halodesulfurarchaeum formicicum]|uniref:Bifunctional protein GlmU n=1 Tax=Halodesulfurarchaeum formicicum TaxID=1873524 RepID=A0A1J1ABC1_9EURY|nr:bifunctional sugar-1-phosphate nucleotidylyltransferase/acetyltransferase [Halodesulfurarchaeum formicicum]APE95083.1 bifunctional UDP-N-acetylglucosamine pyrophosphorylase / glucosamine-1-phosphate N-acetyltransferase [Halodesulfurarchaeum formicicum]
MDVIILAAGRGTRMCPLTDGAPKPMLPVADRPLAAHVADAAVSAGAEKLVFTVGYRSTDVESFFGTEYGGVPVEYAHQPTRSGTADAVAMAVTHVDGAFAVLNGDNVYDAANLARLFEHVPAVGYTRVSDPSAYGVVSTDGGTVTGIVEKPANPPSNLANTGAYAFPDGARKLLDVQESERGERELTDVLGRLVDRETVTAVEFDSWADVAYPWDLLSANEQALESLERAVNGAVHADASLRGRVTVEAGATIDAGVVVDGPVLIRDGATIGPNAYIRGPTVVGPDAAVGHAVEVKNSLLLSGASANHLSYVGDSILGPGANLGAGTVTANLRHDDEPVHAGDDDRPTNRRKFGAVIGPGVKTGINTSLQPGVMLSTDTWTKPGEVVDADR